MANFENRTHAPLFVNDILLAGIYTNRPEHEKCRLLRRAVFVSVTPSSMIEGGKCRGGLSKGRSGRNVGKSGLEASRLVAAVECVGGLKSPQAAGRKLRASSTAHIHFILKLFSG